MRAKAQGGPLPPLLPQLADHHLLTSVDMDAKLADCSICGPGIPIRARTKTVKGGRPERETQCAIKARERNRRNGKLKRAALAEASRDLPKVPPGKKPRRRYRSRSSISNKYKMTQDEYDLMLKQQEGLCLICLKQHPKLIGDHDHATGAIRGLLCNACNVALGFLRDNPESADRAAAYLRNHQGSVAA